MLIVSTSYVETLDDKTFNSWGDSHIKLLNFESVSVGIKGNIFFEGYRLMFIIDNKSDVDYRTSVGYGVSGQGPNGFTPVVAPL